MERLVDDGHAVSIDTWKPAVAAGMIEAGAVIINDTGGLTRPEMVEAVAAGGVAAVVMFLQGDSPLTVDGLDLEASLVPAMVDRLSERLRQLDEKGVHDVVIDPGIGISYRTDRAGYTAHQIDVIRHLAGFGALGRPVLIPVPRKPDLPPTLALATLALEYGADVLRVHDVASVAAIARLMGRME